MKQLQQFFINIAIEIILVMALVSMGVLWIHPFWRQHQEQEKIMLAKSDIQGRLALAIELFYAGHGQYPQRLEEASPYLHEAIPRDPWGKLYQYLAPGERNSKSYDLSSQGPDGLPKTDDDVLN